MSLESVKNIVLILSGKGGVGKSSITTQLALSLSLAGKSVGILDIDLTGPSIPRFLGLEDAKIKQAPGGWLPVEVHESQILPPIPDQPTPIHNPSMVEPNDTSLQTALPQPQNGHPPQPNSNSSTHQEPIGALHAISLAFLLPSRSSAVIWRGPKKTAMVRQFLTDVLWPPSGIDYLLIDTPPGTSDEHIALAETLLQNTTSIPSYSSNTSTDNARHNRQPYLAGAIIVTTPQAVAVSDVRKELNFCKKTGIGVIGVVENMAGFVCECCGEETNLFGRGGGEGMAKEFGVGFLGRVALDGAWGRLVEEGRRPRYGDFVGRVGGEEVSVEGEKKEDGERGGREEGLLVDKYRSCRLWGSLGEIAARVVEIVEGQGV